MKDFIRCFKQQKFIYKVITICLILVAGLFLFNVIDNSIDGLYYPKERYELVNVRFTDSIIDGSNPFLNRDKVPYGTEPPVVYEYAFVNSLVCVLFSFLTGGNTLAAHYLVGFLTMVGTGIVGAKYVWEKSKTTVGSVFCFILLMFCHWRYGYNSAAPDGMAVFLTVLVLYLATRENLKHKELLCTIGLILIFYTKQYMVGICVSLFIYFLINSRKSALKFIIYCVVLTPLSMIIVALIMPYYWTYSVLFLLLGSQGRGLMEGLKYVVEQFSFLSFIFCGLYAVIIAWLIKGGLKKDRDTGIRLFLINIIVQIFVLVYFARNDGTYLTYFLQALYPSIVIASAVALENLEWSSRKWIDIGIYSAVVLFTVYFGWHKLPMHSLSAEEKEEWQEAYSLMDEYRDKGEISHYFSTSLYGYLKGDSLFQTGHDGCLREMILDRWKKSPVFMQIFPDVDFIMEEEFEYRDLVKEKIKKHEISVVVKPATNDWYISEDILKESGYSVIKEMDMAVGNMIYPTQFWTYE